jgi:hypothetical protein
VSVPGGSGSIIAGLFVRILDGSASVAGFSLNSSLLGSSAPNGLVDGLIWPKAG